MHSFSACSSTMLEFFTSSSKAQAVTVRAPPQEIAPVPQANANEAIQEQEHLPESWWPLSHEERTVKSHEESWANREGGCNQYCRSTELILIDEANDKMRFVRNQQELESLLQGDFSIRHAYVDPALFRTPMDLRQQYGNAVGEKSTLSV